MNKISYPEKNQVVYAPVYRKYTEFNTEENWMEDGTFKMDGGIQATVIRQDEYTIVIFDDGSKGVANCGENEHYSRNRGLKIAYTRAMIEHLQRQLEVLCKE